MITYNCYRKWKTLNETSSIILVSKKSPKNFNSCRTLGKRTRSQGNGGGGRGGTWHVRKINGLPLYWSPKHWIYFKTTLSIPCLYFSCHSSSYSVSIPVKVRMIVTFPPLFLLICFKLLITQTFFDFPTRFELSGSTVFYLPNQPIRAPEQIRNRLSYQYGISVIEVQTSLSRNVPVAR